MSEDRRALADAVMALLCSIAPEVEPGTIDPARPLRRQVDLDSMNWLDALIIGLFQVIAVFPGASRSGTTISAGMFRGFDRKSAARFAFLMSVPVMLAAGGYEMLDVIKLPNIASFLPVLAVGFIAAAIVGWLAIKWLLGYLNKHSLYVFAGYCAVVGLALLLIQVL